MTGGMRFRTPVEPLRGLRGKVSHRRAVVMLGSCFTDNIGGELEADGFSVVRNPLGPLYNPASLARTVERALDGRMYDAADASMVADGAGTVHCLDYAMRYSGPDAATVAEAVNVDFGRLTAIGDAGTVVITMGTAWVYEHRATARVAGNCHKLPAAEFSRRCMSVDEIAGLWEPLTRRLSERGATVVFTVSPVRHLGDGAHGNTLSKATLHLAVDRICSGSEGRAVYFPAFEIMNDDLRDYRFYADDMKHPSAMAVKYIYSIFAESFYTDATAREAAEARKAWLHAAHRPGACAAH